MSDQKQTSDLSKDEIIEKLVDCISSINSGAVTMVLYEEYPDRDIRPKPQMWSALNVYRGTTKALNETGFSSKISNKKFMEVFEDLFNKSRPFSKSPMLAEVHERLKDISNG